MPRYEKGNGVITNSNVEILLESQEVIIKKGWVGVVEDSWYCECCGDICLVILNAEGVRKKVLVPQAFLDPLVN